MKYVRNKINKIVVASIAIFFFAVSCDTDNLHDLNINPQALNEVNMNYLFTAAQLGSAAGGSAGDNRYIDWRTNIGFCAYAIQQLANAGGGIAPGDKYTDNVESFNAPWEFIYGDQLKNIAEILRQTGPDGFEAGQRKNMREAARILRVFNFHRLTDYYGNIPYSDALQGIQGTFLPEYDDQQTIYLDLLKELDEATAALSASNPDEGFAAADLYYDGDITKWKKWGYSLMLRLAMRISNVDATTAATYVGKAVSGGVFTSNDDNTWVPMDLGPSEWTNQNGISRAFAAGDGGQPSTLSKTLVDMLKGANTGSTADDDPRLSILSNGVDGDTDPLIQEGMPNGLDQGTLDLYVGQTGANAGVLFSRINLILLDDDDPYMLMNYAEVEFLLAEAAERGIGGVTGAAAHYNAGVRAAMQMYVPYAQGDEAAIEAMTVTDAQVDAYLAARPYTAGAAGLEMIGNQMWISKFFNWWEAWSDWRRTGFPVLTPVNYPNNVTDGTIPVRLKLPTHETAVNQANIQAGATLPDQYTTKVWWDAN
ncbi:SusD/RagB family nutrient-binding outer membrane lipoprotein [uncultured Imperialibacter sp.]|mgnify:CR=1 FL=1|uniref:SusD/RagB family nutrient-binding outer membrane lipoprotein n=1 Tax=uncultured Imperialibacter sp. TaxID=1672639 RepID=UPI0030DA8423|tara:strand:- start:8928 stop:10538 length:1611 start_codon:yes stop_codon:yes gene_type:complete